MQRDWRDYIKKGDVLRARSGDLRVVREVSTYSKGWKAGMTRCITLVIRNCSWTHRPYTVLNRTDIAYRGLQPTGMTYDIDTEFDKDLAVDFKDTYRRKYDCCDVKGIP